jgi:hypothetical protein
MERKALPAYGPSMARRLADRLGGIRDTQRFTNGSTRWTGPTFKGTHVNNKWGVYRSGPNKGRAVNWVNHPRLGTTYDSVAL